MKIYFEYLKQMQCQIEHLHEEMDSLNCKLYEVGKEFDRIVSAIEKDALKEEQK